NGPAQRQPILERHLVRLTNRPGDVNRLSFSNNHDITRSDKRICFFLAGLDVGDLINLELSDVRSSLRLAGYLIRLDAHLGLGMHDLNGATGILGYASRGRQQLVQPHTSSHVDTLRRAYRTKDDGWLAASPFGDADTHARLEQILCVSFRDTRLNLF